MIGEINSRMLTAPTSQVNILQPVPIEDTFPDWVSHIFTPSG